MNIVPEIITIIYYGQRGECQGTSELECGRAVPIAQDSRLIRMNGQRSYERRN
jgi:hypothetical protein